MRWLGCEPFPFSVMNCFSPRALAALVAIVAITNLALVRPAAAQEDPLVKLSPFVLAEDQNGGYAPAVTLSGTRLRTLTKDVASAPPS